MTLYSLWECCTKTRINFYSNFYMYVAHNALYLACILCGCDMSTVFFYTNIWDMRGSILTTPEPARGTCGRAMSNEHSVICNVAAGYIQHCRPTSRWWLCRQRIRNLWHSTSLITCEVRYSFDWVQMTRRFSVISHLSAAYFCTFIGSSCFKLEKKT